MCKVFKLLDNNLMGESFYSLLDFCFNNSIYFALKSNQFSINTKEHQSFLDKLNPFLIKELSLNYWHCYPPHESYLFNVYVFNTDSKAKDILKSNFNDLYFDTSKFGTYENNQKPDDLCFFTKNSLNNKTEILLGTVSHELMCNIYPKSDSMLKEFEKLGNWKETRFFEPGFITLDF